MTTFTITTEDEDVHRAYLDGPGLRSILCNFLNVELRKIYKYEDCEIKADLARQLSKHLYDELYEYGVKID